MGDVRIRVRGQSGIRSGDARHESERKESRGATATDGDLSARALYLHLYYISTCYIGVLRVTIARSQFIGSPADNATKRRFSHHSHQRVIHFDFVSPLARIIERTNETYASTDVDELVRGVDFGHEDVGQPEIEDGTNGESDGDENEDVERAKTVTRQSERGDETDEVSIAHGGE